MALAVIGAGELGGRVARMAGGDRIAITRTDKRHAAFERDGIQATTEWPTPGPDDRVLLALPGSAAQGEAVARLAALGEVPGRVVLVSTVGYHRPYIGKITPESPAGTGSRAELASQTEQALLDWAGENGVIVRLAGLWRVGRGPLAAFARKGSAPLGPPNAPLPLIHYDDAARLVHAACTERDVPQVLLGVVSCPDRATFYSWAAAQLGVPPPPFSEPTGTRASFVDPAATALLGDPLHADWREGLSED